MSRSFNGGESFGQAITITTRKDLWDWADHSRFPGTFPVYPTNYFAVDQNNGTLYCVYFDTSNIDIVSGICNGDCNVDLYFTKSTDQGVNWTTPVVINGDGNPPGDQFFPWIEVDEESNLHMVFLDSRHTVQGDDAVHGMFDAYYSFSNDGGDTWKEFRLTPVSFDSDNDGLNSALQFMGDYLGLSRSQDRVYPCYLSTQNGDPDIYTHVITILGGCCLADSCALLSRDSCATQSGTFLGTGTTCTSTDCNNNSIPDSCDIASGTSPDCNSNGVPDECDITGGTSCDLDANGVPDECQTSFPKGACCLDPGPPQVCVNTTQCACDDLYGNFAGVGTKCATTNCLIIPMLPQPGGDP